MFSNYSGGECQYNFEDVDGRLFCWIKTPRYNPLSIMRLWGTVVFAIKVFFVPVSKAIKPDIIIVSSMPIFSVIPGWLLKIKYKAEKFIFEVRDLWPLTPIYIKGYSPKHPIIMLVTWLERLGYRKADHIVSLLPNAAEYINSISKKPEKFFYIPNGISEDLLGNETLPEDIEKLLPQNKFIVGYAGTIGLANALEYFTEAALSLKDHSQIHFVLVGDGYLKQSLIEKTSGLPNITFVPKIMKSYMQNMISHFDVCFIGRKNTPLFDHGVSSNKYFDYMLASKPVLVSSNRIKDPIELSGGGIIVEPESANAICEGILQLYSMTTQERQLMGAKGHEYVKKFHNFSYLSKKYESLFH